MGHWALGSGHRRTTTRSRHQIPEAWHCEHWGTATGTPALAPGIRLHAPDTMNGASAPSQKNVLESQYTMIQPSLFLYYVMCKYETNTIAMFKNKTKILLNKNKMMKSLPEDIRSSFNYHKISRFF